MPVGHVPRRVRLSGKAAKRHGRCIDCTSATTSRASPGGGTCYGADRWRTVQIHRRLGSRTCPRVPLEIQFIHRSRGTRAIRLRDSCLFEAESEGLIARVSVTLNDAAARDALRNIQRSVSGLRSGATAPVDTILQTTHNKPR